MARGISSLLLGVLLFLSHNAFARQAKADSARALYQEAMRYHREGEFARVVALCKQAVALDLEYTEAHRELIDHVANRDSLKAAYRELRQAYPKSPVFPYLLARMTDDVEEKASLYSVALSLDSTYPWAHIGMGFVHLQKNDPQRAAQFYGRAVELDPRNSTAYQGLAQAYARAGRPDEEKQVYERMLQAMPDKSESYTAMAGYYRQRGENELAATYYRRAYERFRDDPEGAAMALYWYAATIPDTVQRIELFERYLKDYPGGRNLAAVYRSLLDYYKRKQPEKAIELAHAILDRPLPKDQRRSRSEAFLVLQEIYTKQGKKARADSLIERLLQANERNPLLYAMLAERYKSADPQQAVALYRKALEQTIPENLLGTVAFGSFSQEQLRNLAEEGRATLAIELADVLNDLAQYNEVVALLEQLLPVGERFRGPVAFQLGRAYAGGGRLEEAVDLLCEAVIVHKMDEAKAALRSAYEKQYGSLDELPEKLIRTAAAHLDTAWANGAQAPAATGEKLSVDEAILRARTMVSKTAPTFTVTDLDGQPWSLESLQGKVVLLNFWATWCGPCRQELPHLQKAFEIYQNAGDVRFLAVSIDDAVDVVRRFIEKNEYTFPVAHDPNLGKIFGVTAIPTNIILTGDGTIHYRWMGFNPQKDLVMELREKIEPLRKLGAQK